MLKYLAGPLIGAVIGCFTNYIAVRMLFRPREEKRIFGHRVPLTPGAIPKGKARLARAAGEVVSSHLVTEEDIGSKFLSEEAETMVTDKVIDALRHEVGDAFTAVTEDQESYDRLMFRLNDFICREIVSGLQKMDMDSLLEGTVREQVAERISGTVIALFVNDGTLDKMMDNLGGKIKAFIDEQGYDKIFPIVSEKMTETAARTGLELLEEADVDEAQIRAFVAETYRSAVTSGISAVMRHVDIAGTIESKINDMPADELERLVLSVMKKELDTIVGLGALIGALIGLLNIFI